MSKKRKIPAPKTTRASPKKGAATTAAAPKDAATTTTPTTKPPRAPKARDARLPAVGASIDRVFKGKVYKLMFLDEGAVEVDGKVFSSLSAAARHVTGAASINGYLWAGLTGGAARSRTIAASATPGGADAKPTSGTANDLATVAGQRAALMAAGLVRRPKGTPEQIASAAKARAARAAKKTGGSAR